MKKYNLFFIIILFLILQSVFILADGDYGNEITSKDYIISRDIVKRTILVNHILEDYITIENNKTTLLEVRLSVSPELEDYVELPEDYFILSPNERVSFQVLLKGENLGEISGSINFFGDIQEIIPVELNVTNELEDPLFLIESSTSQTVYNTLQKLEVETSVTILRNSESKVLILNYSLIDSENKSIFLYEEEKIFNSSFSLIHIFPFKNNYSLGEYNLIVTAVDKTNKIRANSYFTLKEHFLFIHIFWFIKLWMLLAFGLFLVFVLFVIFSIRRKIKSKKKYRMELVSDTLPKPNKDFLFLGKVAETKIKAYLEPERLKTHTIVAGATGGGKSISAQVIVEEALLNKVAVVVFDPTAQWSGMLRKCDDKKMMSYYPLFGLKPQDAKAFPGNIRMVEDARQIIDLNKYVAPGQIQIFALNKLDPKDMDIFVANVIRQIFRNDPKESPELKILFVFDEVHRLLPKFGGSGEGFLQIERACREFRKWGMGVMLISQVLSDFVGEVKANINTEVQMRTRDEGDLERINTKYGEEFLQSLVKASIGVGMFVNPYYNKGKPYFINFRPILHNTRRLSDEELIKYNEYNIQAEDIEFEIEELEKLKIDVFDLKMELKLVKDKIMTGNFSVVDIYLQGLKPRLEKQWQKLGKKAPKRKIQLADMNEIKKAVEEAKKAREEYEAKEGKKNSNEEKKEEKVDLTKKIVASLTFDNGMMLSSLDELVSVLPDLDIEIFKISVEKNEISNWAKNVSLELSKQLDKKTKKEEVIEIINKFVESLKVDEEEE